MARKVLDQLVTGSGRAELTDTLFAAAEDESAWAWSLERIGAGLSATTVSHHTYDHHQKRGVLGIVSGVDGRFVREYEQHFSRLNAWVLAGRNQIRPGDITVSHLMCADELLFRTEWFHDWCRPQGLYSVVSAVLTVDSGVALSISFGRGRREGHFDKDEQRFLRTLVPHLERSWRLRRRLAQAGFATSLAPEALDRLPLGVVLLDHNGRVVAANLAAREILARRDGLVLRNGRLTPGRPSATQKLESALAQTLGRRGPAPPCGSVFRVGRLSFSAPYEVWLAPLPARTGAVDEPRVVLFIADPQCPAAVDPGALRSLHGLTAAESRAASALVACGCLADAATALGLAVETVRTHLDAVRRKIGVSTNAELVGRLTAGASALVQPPTRTKDPPRPPQPPQPGRSPATEG